MSSAAVQNALPDRYTGSSVPAEVQLWLAVPVALFAALLAHRRAIDLPRPAPGRAQAGPVAVAAVAGALTLAGLADRSWLVRTFRLSPDGLAGHRRRQVVEALSHYSLVVIAAVVALVLIGYAYRVGRAAAARWVVLGAGAGPVLLHGFPLETATSAQRAYLVTVTGAAALTAGALLARHAAGLLPWDAIGLLVAAAATPLASPVVRSELPSAATVHPVLVTLGLGLALGFGVVLVAAPGPDEDTGRLVGLLALGPAALVLSALALAPVVLRSQMDTPYREPMLTVPVFAAGAAGLLVLLFGFQRAVDRIRRDLRAEAARAGESA